MGATAPGQDLLDADISQLPANDQPLFGNRDDPPIYSARTATTLGEALDGEKQGPKEAVGRIHGSWGRTSSQQLKRILAGAGGKAVRPVPFADEIHRVRDARHAFNLATEIPAAAAPSVASFDARLQVDPLFLDDIVASHAPGLSPRYPPLPCPSSFHQGGARAIWAVTIN